MDFRAGDIAACYGTDALSRTIRWGTASLLEWPRLGPSHVAILAVRQPHNLTVSNALPPHAWQGDNERGYYRNCAGSQSIPLTFQLPDTTLSWWESTTLCRHSCLIGGQPKSGMQVHRPVERIRDYIARRGGRVEIYRLAHIHRLRSEEEYYLSVMLRELYSAGYDYHGALLSGTRVFQLSRLFPRANLHSLFCSEMIAAVLMRLNRMNHDNPGRMNPARLLRTLLRTGIYYRHCWYERSGVGSITEFRDHWDRPVKTAGAGLVPP